MHDFVFLGSVYADVLCRPVVRYLGVERCQLWHFDEIAETLLLHNFVGDGELVVDTLLGEDSRPSIEGLDILLFQCLRAEVLKEQIQLREAVGDGRSRKEGRSQVPTRPLLNGADGKEHVKCTLASLAVA